MIEEALAERGLALHKTLNQPSIACSFWPAMCHGHSTHKTFMQRRTHQPPNSIFWSNLASSLHHPILHTEPECIANNMPSNSPAHLNTRGHPVLPSGFGTRLCIREWVLSASVNGLFCTNRCKPLVPFFRSRNTSDDTPFIAQLNCRAVDYEAPFCLSFCRKSAPWLCSRSVESHD